MRINGQVLSNVVAIAAGWGHSQAIKDDGNAIAWGAAPDGSQMHVALGLSNVVSVAGWYSVVVRRDGTVANMLDGKTWDGLSNVVAIAAPRIANGSLVALHKGGSVTQGGLSAADPAIAVGVSNVVAIAAGGGAQNLALRSDGTVFAWRGGGGVPDGLSNVVAIAAGRRHSLALRNDGTVVTWGFDAEHYLDVPSGLSNVVAIAAGDDFSLAITTNSTVLDKSRHTN